MLFAYDLHHWLTFLTAAVLLNIAPGPDMGFILAHTVRGGRASGFAAMAGVWTGAMGHVLFAAVGLSAIIVASATAYSVVKYAGAAYLLWLGIQALRSKGGLSLNSCSVGTTSLRRVFAQGVFIDLLNPKAAIFFLAFLPQFVEPGAGSVSSQLLLHGVLIIVVAAFVEPPLVLMGGSLTNRLRDNQRFCTWLDRSLGGFFTYLGLRLAFSER
ncbi:LysE family translocator [Desulfovibrio ferrophilus]|uniref:Amino acid efflux protein n=1 Tax=Desulfovibrio ferrophilus TaxID=241368 RepID=A0A2Z6B2T0_9BACT|nr:LysE family translocator [Desulfovibrio ferrophilus]BBD09745.1 amino acid efflux protein [Desulfovibrio ferrophilus]